MSESQDRCCLIVYRYRYWCVCTGWTLIMHHGLEDEAYRMVAEVTGPSTLRFFLSIIWSLLFTGSIQNSKKTKGKYDTWMYQNYEIKVSVLWVRFNPLNPELNPICYLLALLGAHHFLHVSRLRVKSLTLRRLMSYIYGEPILDVSRSHTTTQHSR